jgi:hypothetical protein
VIGGVLIAFLAVAAGIAYYAFGRYVHDFVTTLEEAEEARNALRRLEERKGIGTPSGNEPGAERVSRMVSVIEQSAAALSPRQERLLSRVEELERNPGLAFDAVTEFVEARIDVANALLEAELPLSEFWWTASSMLEIRKAMREGQLDGIGFEHRELAETNAALLDRILDDSSSVEHLVMVVAYSYVGNGEVIPKTPQLERWRFVPGHEDGP